MSDRMRQSVTPLAPITKVGVSLSLASTCFHSLSLHLPRSLAHPIHPHRCIKFNMVSERECVYIYALSLVQTHTHTHQLSPRAPLLCLTARHELGFEPDFMTVPLSASLPQRGMGLAAAASERALCQPHSSEARRMQRWCSSSSDWYEARCLTEV